MIKEQLIANLKVKNPTLVYRINDEVFEMLPDQYEQTIESWADGRIAKEQAKADAEALRNTKISAYQKMGLTEAEIEALLPTPVSTIYKVMNKPNERSHH
jgi:hypothetical protein